MSNVIALRYLKPVSLYKITKSRLSNGALKQVFTLVGDYNAQLQEMTDSISISLYGAKVDKMYRLTTPYYKLESFLKPINISTSNNLSDYMIVYSGGQYRINVAREKWIDIEYVGEYEQNS